MEPRVTILIAAWNAAEFLPKAIATARAQDEIDVEIVVVDDASTDDTQTVATSLSQLIFARLPQNQGPSAARNAALDLATSDWIAVLDADDSMTAGRLSYLVALAIRTEADVVLGNFIRVDPDGRPIDTSPYLDPAQIDEERPLSLTSYVFGNLLAPGHRDLGYLKPLFRRSFLERHGIRYDPGLRNSEDYHIILRCLAAGGRVVVSAPPDYLYRVAAGSISHIVPPTAFQALLTADKAFRRLVADQMTPQLDRLLAKRERNLRNLMNSEQIMLALKSRDLSLAAKTLVRHPQAWGRVSAKLSEAVRKRL